MSEFPSEADDRESLEVSERAARYRAMPVRTIKYMGDGGKAALLDCGHIAVLTMRLEVGDGVRCRVCYEAGMRMVQEMMERDCG